MPKTIRGRIIALFAVFLISIITLTFFNWWSIGNIYQKFLISEHFEDMFNSILEVRRYEKNFLFYHDKESLNENLTYINRVILFANDLQSDIENVLGNTDYRRFHDQLDKYKAMMEAYAAPKDGTVSETKAESIRSAGKDIGDFAEKLLMLKRDRIYRALKRTMGLPFAFLAVFVMLATLVAQLIYKRIMKPLILIRETIDRVAQGDLRPITYEEDGKDEISKLIYAFNSMSHELESKQEQLVQSRKIAAIGTFTAGIAHELNNPINNIYLTAETLLDDYENLSKPEGKELILDVLNQAERAGEIIKNLLDFSRSELPSFTGLNVVKVIEKTLKLVKNQTFLAGIQIEVDTAPDLPDIQGNFRNLEQVFLNLFINAIQAMPAGGTITINAFREANDYIKIDIKDSGVGIKPEQLEHIFEPFYTTKSVGRGTGLGLAVSYALVKKHGGYIEVKSKVNVGTTFSIYLPVKAGSEQNT
ncbi:MAG: HAMP domain-containing protein [Deltaproteobacteria bacterium]|nr:HAMP domain-containing protein [Deltaproteobacteria bacterium]